MRYAPQIPRAVFVAVLFSVAVLVPQAGSRAGQPPPLSGEGIKQLISGATVHLHTPLGTVIPVVYGEDGSLKGKAGFVAFFLGSTTDRGRWWVTGSRLCQKWKIWFKGRKNCLEIRRKGSQFHWRDGKGDSGMATIVSRPVVASRTKSKAKRKPVTPPAGVGGPVARDLNQKKNRPAAKAKPAPRRAVAAARVARPPLSLEGMRRPRDARRRPVPAAVAARETVRGTGRNTGSPKPPTFRVVHVGPGDVLNVRRSPSADSAIVGALAPSSGGVKIVGPCRDYWCRVVHSRGSGWVNRAYLAMETSRGGRRLRQPRSLRFRVVRVEAGDVLNIRSAPSADAPVASTVPANAGGIRITGPCRGQWCPIVHARRHGWVNRYFIAPVTVSSSRTR